MNDIKIVRLKNGEDIIAYVTDTLNGELEISEPMTVSFEETRKETGLVMRSWLPIQLIKKNEVKIPNSEVLCCMEPGDEFVEYYCNMVVKFHELLKARELAGQLSDEEIQNMIDDMDDSSYNGDTIH